MALCRSGGPDCCPQCPKCVAPTGTCNGQEQHGHHTVSHPTPRALILAIHDPKLLCVFCRCCQALPFVHPAGNCTSELCAVFATSLDGPWSMRNVDSPCTNNAVPFQLKNGSLCAA